LKTGAGGWITGMDIHPSGTPKFARSDVGGAYVLNENTNEWQQVVNAFSMPSVDVAFNKYEGVTSIVSAPSNNQTAYLAFNNKIYKSTNQAANWLATNYTALNNIEYVVGMDNFFSSYEILPNKESSKLSGERLAVDPINENVVYFGSSFTGLRYTFDGGNIWLTHSDTSLTTNFVPLGEPERGIRKILFDPFYGSTNGKTNRIYAFVDGEDVYMSNDAGNNWQALGLPITFPYFYDAEVNNGKLYVTGANSTATYFGSFGFWEFNNSNWNLKYDATSLGSDFQEIAIDPNNSDRAFLFADLFSEILRTTDLSSANPSWNLYSNTRIANTIPWMAWTASNAYTLGQVMFDPIVSNKLWIAMGTGVYTSTDLNDLEMTWEENSAGQEHLVSSGALTFPDGTFLTSHWDFGIFKHNDPNVYPSEHKPTARFSAAWEMDQSPQDPYYVVAVIEDNRYCCIDQDSRSSGYSTDGGNTWTKFASMPDDATETAYTRNFKFGQIAISATDKNNLIWQPAVNGGELPWFTFDNGNSWTQATIPNASAIIGIQYDFFETRPLTADKVLANTFYLYDQAPGGYIFKTTDGGLNWTRNNFVLNYPRSFNAKLEAIRGKANHLLWANGEEQFLGNMTGLWFSSDGSNSFVEIPNTNTVVNFSSGAVFPGESYPAIYFQGAYNNVFGYWMSIDSMQTWYQIGDNPLGKYESSNVMKADPFMPGKLVVGTNGQGFIYHEIDSLVNNTPHIAAENNYIEIFPNPTNSIFTITGTLQDYTIQILDSNGNVHQTLAPVGNTLTIDISNLPSGLYFVTVTNNSNSNLEVKKIIKQ